MKERLDVILVERELAESREMAQRMIMSGQIQVRGVEHPKPGIKVDVDAEIILNAPDEKFVSRGRLKLEAALARFQIKPSGWICLDVGASTGGFTDCLLQKGAVKVYAVDVGYGQLHYRLRSDPRIILLEKVNARFLSKCEIPEPVDLAVIDVSFISLRMILPAVKPLLKTDGKVIPLIKPQFEAGRERIPKGGVIKDEKTRNEVLDELEKYFDENGWSGAGFMPSPIKGASGNVEFLTCLMRKNAD